MIKQLYSRVLIEEHDGWEIGTRLFIEANSKRVAKIAAASIMTHMTTIQGSELYNYCAAVVDMFNNRDTFLDVEILDEDGCCTVEVRHPDRDKYDINPYTDEPGILKTDYEE